jgi:CRP/FNR family transcriptional regulator
MRKITCERCDIRNEACIVDIPPEEMAAFYGFGSAGIYKPRQVIFHEGAAASGLYIVCHGVVKLYQSDRLGRDYILAMAEPGDVLGEMPSDEEECYAASAEAVTEVQLCFLPRARLGELLQQRPTMAVRLVAALSKALAAARRRARDLALKGAESRLAGLLEQLANGDGEPRVSQGYSRREIAEMIGVSPETAIRLLSRLKERGIVATEGRAILIRNPERLGRLARQHQVG